MKKTVWVVVANRGVARLFQASQPTGPLEEMDAFIHPEARLHDQDLVSDRPGRGFDRAGPGRHAEEPDTTVAEQETTNFALELSRFLLKGRTDKRFDALVLIAAPAFLGSLRERLDGVTRDRILLEVAKNLVHLDPIGLRQYLPERLYSAVAS
ncbi:host attachment protein [Dyella sp. C11]|uniref:host attachment protein n=1 Tax=Dyella sp. C11 TaxID=2126991 RepID=UPI000D64479F|nr:host attachment protein [Dyella sp. C11]